jgi:hypothetical protein
MLHNNVNIHIALARRTSGANPDKLPKNNVLSDIWEHWIEKYFYFLYNLG